jgi:hypothetical protein
VNSATRHSGTPCRAEVKTQSPTPAKYVSSE